ncbi:MAG TPA: hypothetical protein VK934_13330 [Fimbriimonas sp.]|nr:hypothetical protein [Fimbriimonas sp.]
MKPFITLLLLIFAVAGVCQSADPTAPTSRSNEVAQSVYDRIAREVSARSSNPDDASVIGRNPMRIVFLIDTSQATEKDFYPPFVGKVVAGVLRRIGKAQMDAKVPDDALVDVWFYPYQLDLIRDPAHVLKGERLKRGGGIVQKVFAAVPKARVSVPGEGKRGHDSSKARRSLVEELGPASGARETLIVQITTMPTNSDPDRPENHARIKGIDARSGLLEDTDYVAYSDEGRYYQTDAPGGGVSPSDIHVWLYGPSRFDVPAVVTAQPVRRPTPPVAQPPSDYTLLIILLILAIPLIYVVYRLLLKFPVMLGDQVQRMGVLKPLSIVTAGHKGGEGYIQIPPERLGQLGKAQKVGEIKVPFLFGGPRVNGAGGHSLHRSKAPAADLPLVKKPVEVEFVKGENRSELVKLSLR